MKTEYVEKWIDEKERPETYKLVRVLDSKGKIRHGWWSGTVWDGHRIKDDIKVVAWNNLY